MAAVAGVDCVKITSGCSAISSLASGDGGWLLGASLVFLSLGLLFGNNFFWRTAAAGGVDVDGHGFISWSRAIRDISGQACAVRPGGRSSRAPRLVARMDGVAEFFVCLVACARRQRIEGLAVTP
jgi:hypothetical protein